MSFKKVAGFTLLELLVVLVIIGLLAGVVGPRLFSNVDKSEITTAKVQVESFTKAIDQYRLDMGHYPSTSEGLEALTKPNTNPNWHGPYLKKAVPVDPWQMPYQYEAPGRHNVKDYDVYSFGPDRIAGGEDENKDIGNW